MTREERTTARINAKLEKEQKKQQEKELKEQKKQEKKNNRFLKRLKRKIESLFDSDKLTFMGKVYMLSIYGYVLSAISIIVISAVRGLFKLVLFLSKGIKDLSLFSGAAGISWLLFICFFITFIAMSFWEMSVLDNGDDSILEKDTPSEKEYR